MLLFALLPPLIYLWLIHSAWKLSGRDLQGADPYQLLRAPILLAAGCATLSLLQIFFLLRGSGELSRLLVLPFVASPLACLIPAVARKPKIIALLGAGPLLLSFGSILYVARGSGLAIYFQFFLGLLITSGTLIVLASKEKKRSALPRSPQQRYDDRLPLMAASGLCGIVVAWAGMLFYSSGAGSHLMLLGLLGVLPALCLIPSIGRKSDRVIVMNSLALIPAILCPLEVLFSLTRVR